MKNLLFSSQSTVFRCIHALKTYEKWPGRRIVETLFGKVRCSFAGKGIVVVLLVVVLLVHLVSVLCSSNKTRKPFFKFSKKCFLSSKFSKNDSRFAEKRTKGTSMGKTGFKKAH